MGLFSSKKKPATTAGAWDRPGPRRTEAQWRAQEAKNGCFYCGKRGCDTTNHSHSACGACGSSYCNGDWCPGRKGRR